MGITKDRHGAGMPFFSPEREYTAGTYFIQFAVISPLDDGTVTYDGNNVINVFKGEVIAVPRNIVSLECSVDFRGAGKYIDISSSAYQPMIDVDIADLPAIEGEDANFEIEFSHIANGVQLFWCWEVWTLSSNVWTEQGWESKKYNGKPIKSNFTYPDVPNTFDESVKVRCKIRAISETSTVETISYEAHITVETHAAAFTLTVGQVAFNLFGASYNGEFPPSDGVISPRSGFDSLNSGNTFIDRLTGSNTTDSCVIRFTDGDQDVFSQIDNATNVHLAIEGLGSAWLVWRPTIGDYHDSGEGRFDGLGDWLQDRIGQDINLLFSWTPIVTP